MPVGTLSGPAPYFLKTHSTSNIGIAFHTVVMTITPLLTETIVVYGNPFLGAGVPIGAFSGPTLQSRVAGTTGSYR